MYFLICCNNFVCCFCGERGVGGMASLELNLKVHVAVVHYFSIGASYIPHFFFQDQKQKPTKPPWFREQNSQQFPPSQRLRNAFNFNNRQFIIFFFALFLRNCCNYRLSFSLHINHGLGRSVQHWRPPQNGIQMEARLLMYKCFLLCQKFQKFWCWKLSEQVYFGLV